MTEDRKQEWDASYRSGDNLLFYPHEEVVRFVSRKIRKRTGLADFRDVVPDVDAVRVLDLGCGVGRHVKYLHEMGLTAFGCDLSEAAIATARTWATHWMPDGDHEATFVQADARKLPWPDEFFTHAVGHGVLDSMPFEVARDACRELARAVAPAGLFYCDVISGDDSAHAREYAGEEVVSTEHEKDTIQSYFNMERIHALIEGSFKIDECLLIRREDVQKGGLHSRYHLVLERL
jgi:SAM-dependent methyltransferase